MEKSFYIEIMENSHHSTHRPNRPDCERHWKFGNFAFLPNVVVFGITWHTIPSSQPMLYHTLCASYLMYIGIYWWATWTGNCMQFYLWSTMKGKFYDNKPCTENNLKRGKHSEYSVFIFLANLNMQWTTCLVDVMHVSKLKRNIFSTFFEHGG